MGKSGKIIEKHSAGYSDAEEGLKLQERFGTLLGAAPDAMLFVERSGRIILANEGMEKLFGYSREELVGNDLHMLIPERFHGRHRNDFVRFFAEPKTRAMGSDFKIYGLKKDGSEFRADISLSPVQGDGEVFIAAAVRDISDRVRAEERIESDYEIQRAINALLKIALEPSSIEEQLSHSLDLILSVSHLAFQSIGSIYLLDETSDTLVLKAQHGLSDNQLDACSQLPLDDKSGSASCDIAFIECINTPRDILHKADGSYTPYCIPISNGEKVLGLINVFVKDGHRDDPQGKAFLNAFSKTIAVVIQRYQIETEKNKLSEQLVQSEKLAALGRISANVAHEIRNPLTVVGGFARRLQQKAEDEARKREYVDFIVTEVSRLEGILKDILAFARASALDLKEHNVREIIDDVTKAFELTCTERSVNIIRQYDYTSGITIDRNRVREVIFNLISNALDAMPNGGTVSIGTAQRTIDEKPFVTVSVNDTGEGIPQDILDKIFEPFFTTKVAARGVGLGLSICKKIMEDHGGSMTAESTVGTGSTFTLYFPLDRK